LGFAHGGAATTGWRARADLGISAAPFRRPSSVSARSELGRTAARRCAAATRSAGSGARMGRGRARAFVGRTAACRAAASATGAGAGASGTHGTASAPAASRSAGRSAFMERTIGASRAVLGCARRLA